MAIKRSILVSRERIGAALQISGRPGAVCGENIAGWNTRAIDGGAWDIVGELREFVRVASVMYHSDIQKHVLSINWLCFRRSPGFTSVSVAPCRVEVKVALLLLKTYILGWQCLRSACGL